MANRQLTDDDCRVIRERYHGREQATPKTLAAVFGVSVQKISGIVHSTPPSCTRRTPTPKENPHG